MNKNYFIIISIILVFGYLSWKIGFISSVIEFPLQNISELIVLFSVGVFFLRHSCYPQPKEAVFVQDDTKVTTIEDIVLGTQDKLTALYVDCAILSSNIYVKDPSARLKTTWKQIDNIDNIDIESVNNISNNKLGIEVWGDEESKTIAIVFRGTVHSLSSWNANFHWLSKFLPIKNQYEETQALIPDLVSQITAQIGLDYTIITTGHSLGGGLAQYANYLDKNIRYSFVFNSSPVTGWRDVKWNDRQSNTIDSRIYRLYERGEILQFLRFFVKISYLFNPRPNTNPYFVEHRLNLTMLGVITSHNMTDIALGLQTIKENVLNSNEQHQDQS